MPWSWWSQTNHPFPSRTPSFAASWAKKKRASGASLGISPSARPARRPSSTSNYDAALLDLRDQIAAARLEDIPPLIEQMERLQSLAIGGAAPMVTGRSTPRSPYFAHLVLAEGDRRREVLIGRSTTWIPIPAFGSWTGAMHR